MGDLTPRELELARLVAAGFSNQQIASMLVICRQTVKNHIQSVYRKLQVNNRVKLSLCLAGTSIEELQLHVLRDRPEYLKGIRPVP